ncbi:kinase-like protein [Serendipita vermifera]|nr:kinase-like protein [Serendipita vermifera]
MQHLRRQQNRMQWPWRRASRSRERASDTTSSPETERGDGDEENGTSGVQQNGRGKGKKRKRKKILKFWKKLRIFSRDRSNEGTTQLEDQVDEPMPVSPHDHPEPSPEQESVLDPVENIVNIDNCEQSIIVEPRTDQSSHLPLSVANPDPIEMKRQPSLLKGVRQSSSDAVFEGRYSNVYCGTWNNKKVAIKAIRGVKPNIEEVLQREVEVWQDLKHPFVLEFYGRCRGFSRYGALISPWCENRTAESYIRKHQINAPERFRLVCKHSTSKRVKQWSQMLQWCEIVEGVVYLHTRNPPVVHGDLKPENVFVDADGHAKIGDFGLAQIIRDGATETSNSTLEGTARYLSIELVLSDEPVATLASDIHALGCTGVEIIFRMVPHGLCKTDAKIYENIREKSSPVTQPHTNRTPSSVQELWDMFKKCWSIEPCHRPSATTVLHFTKNNKDILMKELDNKIT